MICKITKDKMVSTYHWPLRTCLDVSQISWPTFAQSFPCGVPERNKALLNFHFPIHIINPRPDEICNEKFSTTLVSPDCERSFTYSNQLNTSLDLVAIVVFVWLLKKPWPVLVLPSLTQRRLNGSANSRSLNAPDRPLPQVGESPSRSAPVLTPMNLSKPPSVLYIPTVPVISLYILNNFVSVSFLNDFTIDDHFLFNCNFICSNCYLVDRLK